MNKPTPFEVYYGDVRFESVLPISSILYGRRVAKGFVNGGGLFLRVFPATTT